ncbi:MAG: glutaminyl-peptide cyclotransferase [Reichenbachiella sp.]
MKFTTPIIYILVLGIALFSLAGCKSQVSEKKPSTPRKESFVSIKSPTNNSTFTIGHNIKFILNSKEEANIDSILISTKDNTLLKSTNTTFELPTDGLRTGVNSFRLKIFLSNQKVERKIVNTTLLSNITPPSLSYEIISQHPHNPDSYTQGLFLDGDNLYESTGRKGESNLMLIDLKTGKSVKQTKLDRQYFGEGSTIKGDSIYLLTWQARTGFIYDKKSFSLIGQFQYQTEGWGLTTINNDSMVMSDGTNKLYFMSPEGFSNIGNIEVYDHTGPIDSLNEIEYVDGKIYANRYLTNYIYVIDPKTGKVEAILDLENIYDWSNYKSTIDVLNGIAYNEEKDTYYITGKWWPFLFEIRIL